MVPCDVKMLLFFPPILKQTYVPMALWSNTPCTKFVAHQLITAKHVVLKLKYTEQVTGITKLFDASFKSTIRHMSNQEVLFRKQ